MQTVEQDKMHCESPYLSSIMVTSRLSSSKTYSTQTTRQNAHFLAQHYRAFFYILLLTLLILVGVLSATALRQHGIPSLPPLKTVRPYTVSSAT